eukprot:12913855-Prorocentrum_lima.AAC.1
MVLPSKGVLHDYNVEASPVVYRAVSWRRLPRVSWQATSAISDLDELQEEHLRWLTGREPYK